MAAFTNDTHNTTLSEGCTFLGKSVQRVHTSYVESTADLVQYSLVMTVFLLVFNILNAILTIVANLTVILTVALHSQLRKVPSNLMISSLAFADLLTGLVLQPSHTKGIFHALIGQSSSCTIGYAVFVNAIGVITITASVTSLAFITLDRYIAIVHAISYVTVVTHGRSIYAIIVAWTFSLLFGATISFLPSLYISLRLVWYSYLTVICLLIGVLYVKFYCISKSHLTRIRHTSHPNTPLNGEKRGMATVSMVIVALVVNFIPYIITRTMMRLQGGHSVPLNIARQFAFTFLLTNSSVNPLVYFFRSRNLRAFSRKLFISILNRLQRNCS